MAAIDEIDITSLLWQEGSAPANPAATKWRLYFKTTGLFVIDDTGTETGPLAESSGSIPAPWALVPDGGAPTTLDQATAGANVAYFRPVTLLASVTVTGVYYRVGATSNGNVSVGLYDESLNRLATSGAVACPATGPATTNFSASYAAAPGRYWLAFSSDSGTATFIMSNISGQGTTMAKNATSSHPLPAGPVTPTASNTRAPAMVGLVSGGWAP